MWLHFPFKNFQYVQKDRVFYVRKKDLCTDIKGDNKKYMLLFLHKNSFLSYPLLYGCWGQFGERGRGSK